MKTIGQGIFAKPSKNRITCHGHMASSLVMRTMAVLAFALVANALLPGQGLAGSPLDGECRVLLGFRQPYRSSSGASRTHCGVDCLADAGDLVYAPASGTISFAGNVPAGEEAGSGTATAISIDIGGGLVVTMMPVQSAYVQIGDSVAEGQAVGNLAASGDKSLAQTHLHVGLKRVEAGKSRTYLDPSWLIGAANANSEHENDGLQASNVAELATSSGAGLDDAQTVEQGEPAESADAFEPSDLEGEERPYGQVGANHGALISSGEKASSLLDLKDLDDAAVGTEAGLLGKVASVVGAIGDWVANAAGGVATKLGAFFSSVAQELRGLSPIFPPVLIVLATAVGGVAARLCGRFALKGGIGWARSLAARFIAGLSGMRKKGTVIEQNGIT